MSGGRNGCPGGEPDHVRRSGYPEWRNAEES